MENDRSGAGEEIERRYRIRTMILRGKVKLSRKAATILVGPDCAYHLYSQHTGEAEAVGKKSVRKGRGVRKN
jgi:hypothetical protein